MPKQHRLQLTRPIVSIFLLQPMAKPQIPPPNDPVSVSLCVKVVQDAIREHSLLPQHHRAVQMVKHVGMRIAQVGGRDDSRRAAHHGPELHCTKVHTVPTCLCDTRQQHYHVGAPGGR